MPSSGLPQCLSGALYEQNLPEIQLVKRLGAGVQVLWVDSLVRHFLPALMNLASLRLHLLISTTAIKAFLPQRVAVRIQLIQTTKLGYNRLLININLVA